jgi:hypothetical protein
LPQVDERLLLCVLLRGLLPPVRAYVLQQRPGSVPELLEAAQIAETSGLVDAGDTGMADLMAEVRASRAEVRELSSRMN